jgi:hypothetical protein
METGPFEIQAEHLLTIGKPVNSFRSLEIVIHAVFQRPDAAGREEQALLLSNRINNIETTPVSGMKADCLATAF